MNDILFVVTEASCDGAGFREIIVLMQRPSLVHFLGANRHEFRASLLVALLGFIVVSLFLPIRAFGYDDDNSLVIPSHLTHMLGFFVVGLVALLCSVNAYRDQSNTNDEKSWILGWCLLLCLWVFLAVQGVAYWWGELPTVFKPTWLQNF